MRVVAVSSHDPTHRADKSHTIPATRSGGVSFSEVLDKATTSSAKSAQKPYVVRQGDTLWDICETGLERAGTRPSQQEIHAAVKTVARANALADPDRISVGQTIDLATLSPGDSTARLAKGGSPRRVPPLVPSRGDSRTSSSRKARDTSDLGRLVRTILYRKNDTSASKSVDNPWDPILGRPASLSSGFGLREDPFSGRRQHHDGIDLAVTSGTSVYPLKSGRVEFSGRMGGYGNVVIVSHDDGTETVYGHNKSNLVRAGERVASSSAIALSGSTGRSTGPHLHFEVRVAGRAVNPMSFLERESLQIAKAL